MKKIFTLFMIALFAIDVMAELGYGVTLTQNDFNNSSTVVKKSGTIEWDGDHVRCGGSSNGISLGGPSWNWDDKYFDVKIANGVPNKLSFEWACNNVTSTQADWYVKESANGSTWTDVWTNTSSSISWTSVSKDLKATTRYLRFCFSGNFAGNYRNIKVTEKILMGTPNPETLDFGTVKVDDEAEQTFTLGWTNLTGTATSSDSHFTVTPDAFGEIGANLQNTTFTVTMSTAEAGVYSGTITLEGRDKSAQVAVSGTVEKYNQSINWETADSYNYGEAIPVATATSGLDVDYEISDASVLKFENGAFVALHGGEATVTAKQAGNYKYNAAADVVKTITIVPPTTYGNFEQFTCDEAVEFFNQTYEESFADDVNVGENYLGGDSIVHVNIVINHPTFGEDEKEMTYGEDEEWNGIALKDSTVGVHTVVATIENVAGCDSTVTLTLTVNKMETLNVPVDLQFCAGGSDFFRGVEYSEAGTYPVNATGATRDTIYNVTVTVLQPTTGTDTKTIVYGAEEEWNGISLKDSTVGVHYVVYETTNVAGCDSTVTLTLTVNKQATVEMEYPIEFCAEDQQTYRGVVYTEAGSFPLDLIEGTISDTLITVVVTVHEKMLTNEYVEDSVGHVIELPEGEWYLGEELLEASTYELQVADTAGLEFVQYGETEKGCESVAKIIVTVLYEEETVDPGQTTALERVKAQTEAVKEFRNGTLYIRRGERLFTAEGREVK